MEPSMSAQIEKEPKERKKIQFGIQEEPKERKKIQFEMEDEKPKERKKIQFEMEDKEPKERKKIQFEIEDEDEEDEDEEPKERKIHFAVPTSVPTNLDPRQVEMIRRRRPTPATLFRVADQGSPEDDQSTHQWVVGENGVLKPKRVNPNVYQPPSLRAVQKMAEAHMLKLGVYPYFEDPEGEDDDDDWKPREREDYSPTTAADNQETAASERSVKFSSETETTNQSQAPQEEEEEEKEGKMERTENSRGSN